MAPKNRGIVNTSESRLPGILPASRFEFFYGKETA